MHILLLSFPSILQYLTFFFFFSKELLLIYFLKKYIFCPLGSSTSLCTLWNSAHPSPAPSPSCLSPLHASLSPLSLLPLPASLQPSPSCPALLRGCGLCTPALPPFQARRYK